MRIGVNGYGLRESPDDGGTDALHGIFAPYAVGTTLSVCYVCYIAQFFCRKARTLY